MALREILTFPDKRLRQECRLVDEVDDEIRALIDDMAETMYAAPGAGLAAPQIGVPLRVIVCDPAPKDEERELYALINPEIVEEEGFTAIREGCLSCPEIEVEVDRAAKVWVEALDRDGNKVTIEADDFLAIVLQHEIDHLDGDLIVDNLSSLKRSLYKRKRKKAQESDQ